MSVWFRVMCDRHQPPTPVCDIERTATGVAVYPQFAVRVPALEDRTPLQDRVDARAEAKRRGEPAPEFHTGLVRTANPDVVRGQSYWLTCELCSKVGGKKLSARAQAERLAWILDHLDGLEVIEGVEVQEAVPREQWEADPAQPRYTSRRAAMRLLPLARLQAELAGQHPRRGTTPK